MSVGVGVTTLRRDSGGRVPTVGPAGRFGSFSLRAVLLTIIVLVGSIILLAVVIGPASWLLAGSTVRGIASPTERASAITQVRQTLLTAIGGTAALVGIAFTGRTYYLSRRAHFTDRFREAIALLSSDDMTARIGAVYALEHLLIESPRDHDAIIDILSGYIRTRAPRRNEEDSDLPAVRATRENYYSLPHPEVDIQAALTVLGRRPNRPERKPLDLANSDLSGAYMADGRYQGTYFTRSLLTSSYMPRANLDGAILAFADLRGSSLRDAALRGADCRGARFEEATLVAAKLQGAKMDRARGLTMDQLTNVEIDEKTTLRRGWSRALRSKG